MARQFGRLYSVAWAVGSDFRKLSRPAQGTYSFLLSQPDLNQAGLIGLRLKRWVTAAEGYTMDDLIAELEELEAKRYIVVDWDEEEVLVRTFIRNDKVYRQPNVMLAAAKDAHEITSPRLRAVLVEELGKISLDELSDEVSPKAGKSPRAVVAEAIEALREEFASAVQMSEDPSRTPPDGSSNPSGTPLEPLVNPSGTLPARDSISTSISICSAPAERASPEAPPGDTLPADFPDPVQVPETEGQRVNRLTKAYTDEVPLAKFPAVAGVVRKAVRAAKNGAALYDDDMISGALSRLATEGRGVTEDSLRYEIVGFGNRADPRGKSQERRHVDLAGPSNVPPPANDPFQAKEAS